MELGHLRCFIAGLRFEELPQVSLALAFRPTIT